jgi:hypothetical protein
MTSLAEMALLISPVGRLHSRRALRLLTVIGLGAATSSCSLDGLLSTGQENAAGFVTRNGALLAGVELHLTGADTAVITTGSDGRYLFPLGREGRYQITPRLAGHAFQPMSLPFNFEGSGGARFDFAARETTPHAASGTVAGGGSVIVFVVRDKGWNTTVDGGVLVRSDGTFDIEGLPLGSYRLGAVEQEENVTLYEPTQALIDGVLDFEHELAGALGTASLLSVVYGANNVADFFEFPADAPEGTGTIRPRRSSEIAPAAFAAWETMWNVQATVDFTYSSTAGDQTIRLHLRRDHSWSASSVNFELTERLVNATGITFTVVTPP